MKGKPCTDHKDMEYSSESAMCRAYGISKQTFRTRTRVLGWTIKDALTKGNQNSLKAQDGKGVSYKNKTAMCKAHKIPYATYKWREEQGQDVEEALTPADKSVEYKGQKYVSFTALCKANGLSRQTVAKRLANGLPLQIALSPSVRHLRKGVECHDLVGNSYPNIKSFSDAIGLKESTVRYKLKQGWTLQEILLIPTKERSLNFRNRRALFVLNGESYYGWECPVCKMTFAFTEKEARNHYIKHFANIEIG